ncbi:hypothetical protein Rhopal_006416-T1 [Rhodotorula paludigena]|uniref:Uncharacterized protein n=1 Tax=Rhodotorula paludigena TaxID=86838 RepID=A0AAV5GT06_9BASI|nr:hypothetical protein Rhopal_006416-T1 [Rhodotorula paludigena]
MSTVWYSNNPEAFAIFTPPSSNVVAVYLVGSLKADRGDFYFGVRKASSGDVQYVEKVSAYTSGVDSGLHVLYAYEGLDPSVNYQFFAMNDVNSAAPDNKYLVVQGITVTTRTQTSASGGNIRVTSDSDELFPAPGRSQADTVSKLSDGPVPPYAASSGTSINSRVVALVDVDAFGRTTKALAAQVQQRAWSARKLAQTLVGMWIEGDSLVPTVHEVHGPSHEPFSGNDSSSSSPLPGRRIPPHASPASPPSASASRPASPYNPLRLLASEVQRCSRDPALAERAHGDVPESAEGPSGSDPVLRAFALPILLPHPLLNELSPLKRLVFCAPFLALLYPLSAAPPTGAKRALGLDAAKIVRPVSHPALDQLDKPA